jgi:hypothetical protein
MTYSINTTPTLSATVGALWTYTVSAIETNVASTGVSATHHMSVSAVRGPVALDVRFTATSATNATMYMAWYPRVSDVVLSGGESIDITVTAYNMSGTYVNQDVSISAATSSLYGRRTNIGDGTSDGKSDIADFYMRGLGTKG